MKRFFRGQSIVYLVLACALIVCAPRCPAQSTVRLDRHARRIYRELAKYRPGSYLEYLFRNQTDSFGDLGTLSATSFTFTNSDTNTKETHLYGEVSAVKKGKTYIGEGTAPRRHIRLW